MKEYLERMSIVHERVAFFRPQANGLVERVNCLIMSNIQLSLANGLPWRKELEKMIWTHRVAPHSTTGIAPFVSLKGREPGKKKCPIWLCRKDKIWVDRSELKRNVDNEQQKMSSRYNLKMGVKDFQIQVGDWVVVRKNEWVRKGESKYLGPFQVKDVKTNVVILNDGTTWSLGNVCKV